MEPKATTTTPDPEMSMPLDMGAESPQPNQGELPPAGDAPAQQPRASAEKRQGTAAGQAPRRGAQP